MKKKQLISKLENVAGELETFSDDYTLFQCVKALKGIQNNLEQIIQDIEDDGTIEDEASEA